MMTVDCDCGRTFIPFEPCESECATCRSGAHECDECGISIPLDERYCVECENADVCLTCGDIFRADELVSRGDGKRCVTCDERNLR